MSARRDTRLDIGPNLAAWSKQHWFLSFLLASSAISAVAALASALSPQRSPYTPYDGTKQP